MRDLQAIHADRDQIKVAIANAGQGTDISQFQVEEIRYTNELEEATAYWKEQERLQERVEEEVKENGYVLDTLEVDGLTAPEIITDDTQYGLIRRGVQKLVVTIYAANEQQMANVMKELRVMGDRAIEAEIANEQLKKDGNTLETANFQLTLDNEALDEKVRKGAELLHEVTQQIEQQKQHIENLQNQISLGIRGALNVVNIPQDTSILAAEIIANKTRITDVKFKDKYGIDRRTKTAVEVLTGKEIEYQEYVEKRYIILNAEQAEQYRADEVNKKAEIEAQNAVIPTIEPEIEPLNDVTDKEEAATDGPFQDQATEATDSQRDPSMAGNIPMDESLGQNESEVDYECTSLATTDKERIIELEHGMQLTNELLFDLRDRVEIMERYTQAAA